MILAVPLLKCCSHSQANNLQKQGGGSGWFLWVEEERLVMGALQCLHTKQAGGFFLVIPGRFQHYPL
jgi:hypothetical protein